MSQPAIQLTPEQIRELQEGRASLRGSIQITRASTGKVENYDIELRPIVEPQSENSNG